MSNSIDEMLGIQAPPQNPSNVSQESTDNSAEKILSVVANIILIAGILSSLLVAGIVADEFEGYLGFFIFLGGTLSSVFSWVFVKVIINISQYLREIRDKQVGK